MTGPVLRAGAWQAVAGVSGVAVVVGGCGAAFPAAADVLLPLYFVLLAAAAAFTLDEPASLVVSVVATLAMIPAALLLLVLGLMPFAVQTDISYAGLICIFGWVFAASRTGRAAGPRPRQVANCGLVLGAAGMAGAALLAASVPMPANSLSRDITYGAELLAGIPVALYPVWLIVLSYRQPGFLRG